MIAIKNVLVATDFSRPSAVALTYGRELARTSNARLHILHVVDDVRWRYSFDMTPALMVGVQESLEEAARESMKALVTDNDREQLNVQTTVLTAAGAAETIVDHATRHDIDLVVIGTHGRSGVKRLVMGSVAERVVRLARCPVLTVRDNEHEFVVGEPAVGETAGA